ncbi:hypothetical protein Tco_0706594 [Tanacetum coccineum]|uniref:Reverse transcriptase domain-containing protein n=1 Tax=Tanacetum coccineum TaxID=301880 RepID=A0ABQ4Y7U0_9ASTR
MNSLKAKSPKFIFTLTKPVVAKVSSSTSTPGISSDVAELKDMVKALLLDKKSQAPTPWNKPVEESCVLVVGTHSYTKLSPPPMGTFIRDNIHEFTDALMLMPKFASTLKALIGNKEKLSEMARTPLNENCSAVILNKLPKKLGDPGQFLIPYFKPDPRVPLILGRSFLKTSRALIDVYEGEITLCVGREAITFNLDQTSRYTANYNHMTANRINVIDMACKEYSQEVLGFLNVILSGNPTPYYDPIVSTSSPTLTPFGDSDFLLFEEADSFLAIEDDPTSTEVDPTYYDTEGDILSLKQILNSDPSPPLPIKGNYFLEFQKRLKFVNKQ